MIIVRLAGGEERVLFVRNVRPVDVGAGIFARASVPIAEIASSQDFSVLGDAWVMQRSDILPVTLAGSSLDDLEGEFHELAANDEAQIVLPELPEHAAMIHQEFEAKRAPQLQQRRLSFTSRMRTLVYHMSRPCMPPG